MSDTVLAALISTLGLILVALIGLLVQNAKQGHTINRVHAKAEAVREQVQNSHSSNLRDDIDHLRKTMTEGFENIERRQDSAARVAISARNEARSAVAAAVKVGKRLDEFIDGATE